MSNRLSYELVLISTGCRRREAAFHLIRITRTQIRHIDIARTSIGVHTFAVRSVSRMIVRVASLLRGLTVDRCFKCLMFLIYL